MYTFDVGIEKTKNTPVWSKKFLTRMTGQAGHASQKNQKSVYFGVVIEETKKNTPVRRKIFLTGQVGPAGQVGQAG